MPESENETIANLVAMAQLRVYLPSAQADVYLANTLAGLSKEELREFVRAYFPHHSIHLVRNIAHDLWDHFHPEDPKERMARIRAIALAEQRAEEEGRRLTREQLNILLRP
jgi:hypothetical protein